MHTTPILDEPVAVLTSRSLEEVPSFLHKRESAQLPNNFSKLFSAAGQASQLFMITPQIYQILCKTNNFFALFFVKIFRIIGHNTKKIYLCNKTKTSNNMAYKALDIAKKLIKMADFDSVSGGDCMTNMRLQKMLYYEQGYHLAMFDTPLFDEEIEAWMYGPVVPSVYNHYKNSGSQILPVETDTLELTDEENELFGDVYNAYREFSTLGLMNKTHKESPWKSAKSTGRNSVISQSSMKAYFKTQLIDEEEG